MGYRRRKYFLFSVLIALVYWFAESMLDCLVYHEGRFEVLPTDPNELWMRAVIVGLLIAFGIYVDRSVNRLIQIRQEQHRLQIKLDEAMTHLLGGFVSICSQCKKVRESDEQTGADTWRDIESYISQRTDLTFSHGYCPHCQAKVAEALDSQAE